MRAVGPFCGHLVNIAATRKLFAANCPVSVNLWTLSHCHNQWPHSRGNATSMHHLPPLSVFVSRKQTKSSLRIQFTTITSTNMPVLPDRRPVWQALGICGKLARQLQMPQTQKASLCQYSYQEHHKVTDISLFGYHKVAILDTRTIDPFKVSCRPHTMLCIQMHICVT